MRVFLILTLLFSCSFASKASEQLNFYTSIEEELIFYQDSNETAIDNTHIAQPRFKKLKAVLLAVFLGHFGVHRIYLGTSANVPVVYTLTLGGGFGLLPLCDIIAILSSQNLDKFSNNDKVFMWSKAKTEDE